MNLFGLEGSGFIIALSLTLLLVGLTFYYFRLRIGVLERVVAEQNNVLHKFISTMSVSELNTESRNNIRTMPAGESLASPEALEVAREVTGNGWSDSSPMAKKIVSDSESESDTDSDISESNEDRALVINETVGQIEIDTIKTIEFSVTDNQPSLISGACVEEITTDQKEVEAVIHLATPEASGSDSNSDSNSDSDSDSDTDSNTDPNSNEVVITGEVENDLAKDKLVEYELNNIGTPDLASLKVQVLRNMAIEKKLVSKEVAKNMKKNALKDLLS